MKKSKQIVYQNLLLRIVAGIIMTIVLLALIAFSGFVIGKVHNDKGTNAKNGLMVVSGEELKERSVSLNGSWDEFQGVVCETKEDVAALGQHGARTQMPLATVTKAEKDATYRLYIQMPRWEGEQLFLAIPAYQGHLNVFLNGVEQKPVANDQRKISYRTLDTLFPLNDLVQGEGTQELVISGQFSEETDTLYRRTILIGEIQNINARVTFDTATEMFIMGLLLLVLVSGYVFMLFRPGYLLITLITVFDTLMICKIIPTMNYVFSIGKSIFPDQSVSDHTRVAFSIFFLMLAGFTGCVLAKNLFDPKELSPKWLTKPPAIAYLVFAVVFPFQQVFFEQYGIALLIIVYIWTFVGVFVQFSHRWKRTKRRGYYVFQFIKTAYVGGIVFLDLLLWKRHTDIAIWLYLYIVFFLLHVVVRLYDNNRSYEYVERMNQDLEKAVDERTKELLYANQILSELSNRDPLTHAFNRLYFEGLIERLISDPEGLHVCILDLDFFKNVNDTYGHAAGDDMLRRMASIVQQVVGDKAVFARIGGEEFVLVYHKQGIEEVMESLHKLRSALEDNARQTKHYTTASLGVASWRLGDTEKTLIKKADKALYQAKKEGRNKVVQYAEIGAPEQKSGGTGKDEKQ